MRIHYLMHHPDEGLGIISQWIQNKGYITGVTKFYEKSYILPQTSEYDVLIIMGGPQSVYEVEKFDWLKIEKEFIRIALEARKKILGICLGSQFLAEILGGKVYAAPHKEIGWFEIKLSQEALSGLFKGSPEVIPVFHWHGDTYSLPANAVRLASSEATVNQGFAYEDYVLGLQFHFEVDEKAIKGMNSAFDHELVKSKYVQTDVEIKSQIDLVVQNNAMMFKLLDNFIG